MATASLPLLEATFFQALKQHNLEAAQTALSALSLHEDAPEARRYYWNGLLALQAGRMNAAISALREAVKLDVGNASYHNNLGVALLRNEEAESAADAFAQAMALSPEYEAALYGQLSAAIAMEEADKALRLARRLTRKVPRNSVYITALADACRLKKHWRAAFRLYRRALQLDPDNTGARQNLVVILNHTGRIQLARKHCEALLEKQPGNITALQYLGDYYLAAEDPDAAMNAYADAFELAPENVELLTRIGQAWLAAENHEEAGNWFERVLAIKGNHYPAIIGLADIHRENEQFESARERLESIATECQERPAFFLALAELNWDEGDAESALEAFRRAQELEPERIGIYSRIGRVLSSSGDVEGAIEIYRAGLKINPRSVPCLSGLATTLKGKLDQEHAVAMERQLSQPVLRSSARASLHNGLAFYYEGQKDFEQAAAHSRQANQYQWQAKSAYSWDYDPEKHAEHVSRLIRTFTPEYFASLPPHRSSSRKPVFIVSMPRSGTTLTEQILSRHSKVLGIGERNFASRGFQAFHEMSGSGQLGRDVMLRAVRQSNIHDYSRAHLARLDEAVNKSGKQGVERVVDKMPDNYHLLGWIKTVFPDSQIIHIRRDPRDVALSCWMTQFGAISWACHTEHLQSRISHYQRLMQHWRDTLGDDLLEIRYEDLVSDQETVSRKMIDWLGLEWEPECLSFYDSDRLVRTASITQVREPIYQKSVKKWERYQPWLADLLDGIEDKDS